MIDNRNMAEQPCCPSCDCEPPDGGNKTIKTIAFTFIILLALAVTSYSLFFRDRETAQPECDHGVMAKPLEEITNIPGLRERLAGADLALLVLTDTNENLPLEMNKTIEISFSLISEKTSKSEIIILSPDDPDYEKVVDYYIITGFPAVMVLGRYGEKLLVRSGISEETILKAHEKVSNPPAPCCSIADSEIILRT